MCIERGFFATSIMDNDAVADLANDDPYKSVMDGVEQFFRASVTATPATPTPSPTSSPPPSTAPSPAAPTPWAFPATRPSRARRAPPDLPAQRPISGTVGGRLVFAR
jgi:hypothetical protein